MDKLLDCPFCGGRSQEVVSNDVAVVCCMSCFATASPEQWNTRHAPEGWQLMRDDEVMGPLTEASGEWIKGSVEHVTAAAPKWGGE